ncbi:hypothetical protein BH11CYA1_BH11CYA1_08640 [soil metagenome]
MRRIHSIALLSAATLASSFSNTETLDARQIRTSESTSRNIQSKDLKRSKMRVKIGPAVFAAKLNDNVTVTKLKSLLPLTLEMSELNGNEKYFHLPSELPTNAESPETIECGDLMLWGNNSLVLFYKTFKTSYSYTRLGRINDPSKLASAVGKVKVTVSFDLE